MSVKRMERQDRRRRRRIRPRRERKKVRLTNEALKLEGKEEEKRDEEGVTLTTRR